MKDFRIAKCLKNGKVRECAVFSDGGMRKEIEVDEKNGKFFRVDNPFNLGNGKFGYSFWGRIRDAYKTVGKGDGDYILVEDSIGFRISVLYFLDRQVGEKIREKTLNDWNKVLFGWRVECGSNVNKIPFSPIGIKGSLVEEGSEESPLVFRTHKMACDYIFDILNRSKECAVELEKVSKENMWNLGEKYEEVIKKYSNDIIRYFSWDMFVNGMQTDKSGNLKAPNWGYRVVQCVSGRKSDEGVLE